jgi:ABC-type antimicrobial peptide transport system permease subunit
MDNRITSSLVARRSPALLASLFSAIALLLTTIGTYGVLSYGVAQRKREIAIRMALGARPNQIRVAFFNIAVRLFISGAAFGVVGAWLTGKAMQSILFHVPGFNVLVIAATGVAMAFVSLVACSLPADSAARISPMTALGDQ